MKNKSFHVFIIFLLLSINELSAQRFTVSKNLENSSFVVYKPTAKTFPHKTDCKTPEQLISQILSCKSFKEFDKLSLQDTFYRLTMSRIKADWNLLGSCYVNFDSLEYWSNLHIKPIRKLEFTNGNTTRALILTETWANNEMKLKTLESFEKKEGKWFYSYALYQNKTERHFFDLLKFMKSEHIKALLTGQCS